VQLLEVGKQVRREEGGVRDDAQASAPGSAFTWWGHSARACFTLTQSQSNKVKVTDSGNIPIKGVQFYGRAIWQSESKTRHILTRKHEWYKGGRSNSFCIFKHTFLRISYVTYFYAMLLL